MRILWATPYNEKSAIARYSRIVVHELSRRGHAVEILRAEDDAVAAEPPIDDLLRTHIAGAMSLDRLAQGFDVAVVNYGDHLPFHARAPQMAAAAPCVAVFHDANMENFLWGLSQRHPDIDRLLEDWPSPGSPSGSAALSPPSKLLSLLASVSAGCVAHGPHYVSALVNSCPGPVAELALCYPDIGAAAPAPDASGAFVTACFGMINPNKQPERILRALAADPELRRRGRVRFIGPIDNDYREHLASLAATLGLYAPEFYGWVDDARLCALIAEAHLLCCLRHPVTEGGSASVITALYSARPVVVNDVGSYAEIPGDLVLKIAASDDPRPLTEAMRQVASDPGRAEAMAAAGADHALRRYSANAYVDGLEPLLESALARMPRLLAGRRMGARLHRMAPGFDDRVIGRLDHAFADEVSFARHSQA